MYIYIIYIYISICAHNIYMIIYYRFDLVKTYLSLLLTIIIMTRIITFS